MINLLPNKNRTDMAIMFGELGFKRGAEIGVRRGDFSVTLCTHIKSLGKFYAVDPWNVVYADPQSRQYGLRKQNKYYESAKGKLSKYLFCEIIKKTSLEAVRDIEYESLDFVYIDGSHTFDYVMVDIIEWARRVRKGGIVSGDDYKPMLSGNVIAAVDTYIQLHGIKTLNIMEPDKNDEYPVPNWWFKKQ